MKTKILALIACVFVSGTVGAIINNNASAIPTNGNTVTSTVAKNSPAVAAITQNSNCISTKQNASTSSTCRQAAGKTADTACQTASDCAGNTVCSSGSCVTANCKTGNTCGSTCSLGNYTNSASSNCTKNANGNGICVIGNKKITVSEILSKFNCTSGSGSLSKPNSSSSKSATSSKPASQSDSSNTALTGSYSSFQNQVVQLVNQERAKAGLKALTVNSQLTKTATLKSEDMAKLNYFDHTSPTYGSPFDMMKQFGISYRTAGENIAMGQTSPQQVMQGWMNSSGHRANILNSSFTQIGVGIAKNAKGQYIWTQQFIG
ncbi:CAP domain-containing protein [Caproiciproducens galactitolivorans]|uniref:CAP domain-containing protein n=1 Tax=Caproiciproducens galactitolivorans TaxID=642589 RepID=UPI002409E7A9|nr:CAP domain-containing protein [Caproiciproducens galactitolivorans]